MDVTKLVGKNIRRERERKNMKIETLAQELRISKATLSQVENGNVDITLSRLEK